MALFDGNPQNPLGPNPGVPLKVWCKFREAIEVGEIVQFDMEASDGDVTASLSYGLEGNPMSNVTKAVASESLQTQGLFPMLGVAKDTVANDGEGFVYLKGDIPLAWDAASDAVMSAGTAGSANGLISLVSANAERIVAIARETTILYVNGSAVTLTQCYFDGINGFGQFNA